ncbi:MAG TPA: hypothetical protein VF006_20905 [Longimicrobium sp.]
MRAPAGGSGNRGGQVIFQGTPMELLDAERSLTSRYLQRGVLVEA